MAINYASKYSTQIDERFAKEAMSGPAVNQDYDFVGVKTVNVYSVPTAQMNDYTRSGSNRYGTPSELENTVQELTMRRDRSFTFTIDRGNFDDTQMVNSAGAALQRQLREVVIPEVDTYRFSRMCDNAGTVKTGTITKSNAYDAFLDGTTTLIDKKAQTAGAIAYVSSAFYKLIKQDDAFIKRGDLSQEMLIKGQIGAIDGIPIVVLPASYMPEGVNFFITNKIATTAPTKLSEYKIHDNPPGINGWLVEGRLYYDAFVLNNKKDAIYVHRVEPTLGTLTVTSEAGASGKSKITVSPTPINGNSLVYKTAASTAPSVTYDTDLSSWTALSSGEEITATNGHKITVAEITVDGKARKSGTATVVSGT